MPHNHEIVEDDDYKVTIDYDNLTTTFEPKQLSPEEAKRRQLFYQKMAYIEMKKLRPKHPHA